MSHRDPGDAEGFAVFLIILLFAGMVLGWWNLERAMDKCRNAGFGPAFCHDLLE